MFPKSNTPRWIILVLDLLLSAFSLILAYLIRFDLKADFELWETEWNILSKSIIIYFLIRFIVFYGFKIHKIIIRHIGTADFKRLFLASTITSVLLFLGGLIRFYFFDNFYLLPLSVLIIDYLLFMFLVTIARFVIKLMYLESVKVKENEIVVLIYGAGISGLIAKRTIEKDTLMKYKVLGFIDDNPKIVGTRLEGVQVYASSDLFHLIQDQKIKQVIVAIQEPVEENRSQVVKICLETGVEVKKVPSASSWINGEFSSKQMANVKIEDLLGRTPIQLNQEVLYKELSGQVILVTGAAGSIGSGLVKQLVKFNPKLIILMDQAESPLYDLQFELNQLQFNSNIELVVGDVCDKDRIERIFKVFHPKWVFHAAAYKHVPIMEDNPSEAVKNNVKGTLNLVELAVQYSVHRFVMISTDKAVNPTNVMGASKRIAEMIAQFANGKSNTQFITTRFGNVLGSNGSVIPLFRKQIENGGPVTVTDERITRFFMTIPEACQLVLDAGVMGNGGEIFVFDMGEPVKIIDLARNMIQLSGFEVGQDIAIKVTGLRPGEKLYEELLSDKENTLPTHHPKILKAKVAKVDQHTIEQIKDLISTIDQVSNMEIVAQMKVIVPEFVSNNSEFSILDKN